MWGTRQPLQAWTRPRILQRLRETGPPFHRRARGSYDRGKDKGKDKGKGKGKNKNKNKKGEQEAEKR